MIITCPSCLSRYVVDPAKIGAEGRTVKCAKCGHAWAQPAPALQEMAEPFALAPAESVPQGSAASPAAEPTEESAAANVVASLEERSGKEPSSHIDNELDDGSSDDFEPNFGDTVKGKSESAARPRSGSISNLPALREEPSRWPARIAWITLIIVVTSVIGGTLAFQHSITKSWQPATKLYDLIGMSEEPIKQQLGVRNVRYTYPDKTTLRVDGELINLSKLAHDVPNLRILFLNAAGNIVKRWAFPPPKSRMLPHEVVRFSTEIRNTPADAERIDVGVDKN